MAGARKRECGCLIGADGAPIVLCRTAQRMSRRVGDLIPPASPDDDQTDWDTFHRALGEYRRHVGRGTSAVVS